MNYDNLLDALREEVDRFNNDSTTWILIPEKAELAKDLCEMLKKILDDCGATYTMDVRKGALISVALCISIKANFISAAFDMMKLLKEVINQVDEIALRVDAERSLEIHIYIEDAYIID